MSSPPRSKTWPSKPLRLRSLKQRPPTRLADVRGYEIAYPAGYAALRDGEVVMVWGGAETAVPWLPCRPTSESICLST